MSIRRLVKTSTALLLLGGLAGLCPAVVPPAQAQSPQQPAISEDASAALARMGKTLLAKQFSFHSLLFRVYAGPNGELLHVAHNTKTAVRRPDHLFADITGDDGSIKMIYDGKNLVVFNPELKQYASVPMTGTVQEMLDAAESRMGVDFPLSDLLADNPEKSALTGITFGGQVGTATIGGVRCRHFFFEQAPDIDVELWLEDNDRSLPRRVVMTYRSLPGRPNFIAELSDWDFSTQFPDSDFVFQPPAGVVKVELTPGLHAAPEPAK